MKTRIATFNVENLFLRYRLLEKAKGSRSPKTLTMSDFEKNGSILMLGVSIEDFGPVSKSSRRLTQRVILEIDADVLALQEVENLETLKQFNRHFLKGRYPYQVLVDGNDPRQIDVGLLSKHPVGALRTHQFETEEKSRIFSRDCLEVEVCLQGGRTLCVLVNHFKSKIGGGEEKRERQARRVAEILRERFGADLKGDFVVCGDFNAGPDEPELKPLLKLGSKGLENVVARIDDDPDAFDGHGTWWTHYYKKGRSAEQLDFLLLSPSLAKRNPHAQPTIERRGLGTDIDIYEGERFGSLEGKEGASDHCPVYIDVEV